MSDTGHERLLDKLHDYVLAWDDLAVGDRFVTSGRTVTEADIVAFAGLSADYNALHVDAAYAQSTPHGERIAHGLLVLAIASGLATRLPMMQFLQPSILGLANLECRWMQTCRIGDTLRVVVEIAEKVPGRKPDRGTIVMKRTAVNQRDEPVMESVWRIVVRTRDEGERAR